MGRRRIDPVDRVVTVAEAHEITGVSRGALRREAEKGVIGSRWAGELLLLDRRDVEQYEAPAGREAKRLLLKRRWEEAKQAGQNSLSA